MDILELLSQLLRPWSYLKIKAKGKACFDWGVPLSTALALSIFAFYAGSAVSFFGEAGLVEKIVYFLQGLPGFFIAALAAVATFNRGDLDALMAGEPPTLVSVKRGHKVICSLTRRRFLCALFSFLTAQSLLITVLGIFSVTFSAWIVNFTPSDMMNLARTFGLFVFLFLLCQLLSVTSLGLYYLGERMHVPD